LRVYDLAEEWRELTGLPFVFAVWATRRDATQRFPDLTSIFLDAKAEGLKNVEKIVERYARSLALPADDLYEYLTENVNFDLDEESIEGMRHFFKLARECGVISTERELEFCPTKK
jgi:chorismate dehydratase